MTTFDITQPVPVISVQEGSDRKAVLPSWMRNRTDRRAAAKWAAKHYGQKAAFHAVRVPTIYAGRLALYSPLGLWKTVSTTTRWIYDSDAKPDRDSYANDAEYQRKLKNYRDGRKVRAGMVGTPLIGGSGFLALGATGEIQTAAAASIVLGLGALGRPRDKKLIQKAELSVTSQKVSRDDLVEALCAILPPVARAIAKDDRAVKALVGHKGDGWHAEIGLPAGVTASDVIERRNKLASALGRSRGMVHPKVHPSGRENQLIIDITNVDQSERKQGEWPLAKAETIDIFEPFPFGEDAMGDVVYASLDETNWLIGSLPGAGKTVTAKDVMAAIVLDPRSELQAFELKGTGDLRQFAPVCTRYAHGRDDATMLAALKALRELDKECEYRAQLISQLPFDVCPDSKVTSSVADIDGLHPLFLVIDEVHMLTLHPEHGEEAAELMAKILKVDRALGVKLVVATQRPSASSIPSDIRSQFGTRFCLRVKEQPENDMILGTGAYSSGRDATKISPASRGTGILDGQHAEAQTVRVFFLDAVQVQKVVDRALFLRGGEVAKHIDIPEPVEPVQVIVGPASNERNLLADIRSVRRDNENGVWMEELPDRLRDLDPEYYAEVDRDRLRDVLTSIGIVPKCIKKRDKNEGKDRSPTGVHFEDQIIPALERVAA